MTGCDDKTQTGSGSDVVMRVRLFCLHMIDDGGFKTGCLTRDQKPSDLQEILGLTESQQLQQTADSQINNRSRITAQDPRT